MKLLSLLLASLLSSTLSLPPNTWYSLDVSNNLIIGRNTGIVSAIYHEEAEKNGWNSITIETNSNSREEYTDKQKAYSMGYIEGVVTSTLIYNSFVNTYNQTSTTLTYDPKIVEFVEKQHNWLVSQVSNNTDSNYWYHVDLILNTFNGLLDGYNYIAPYSQRISEADFRYFQLSQETGDIATALIPSTAQGKPGVGSHCSAMFKLTKTGIIASHDTWSNYQSMLRLYRHINANFKGVGSTGISYSGYPGIIPSVDDWYMTSEGLTITETTNDVYNQTLFQLYVVPETVPYWIRVTLASRLATTANGWAEIFGMYNSGTYNNQWMVLDNKLVIPGATELEPNTFVVGEQIPGLFYHADQSQQLAETQHWVSYNIPYYTNIYKQSGYAPLFEKFGNQYSHALCARAQIFARDQHKVVDVPTLKKMMRYNQYQTDPLSLHDACRGISARCDLSTPWDNNENLNNWSAFGAIDSKIQTDDLKRTFLRSCDAVSGPTADNQPPFKWTGTWNNTLHFGMPEVFDFDFVPMEPTY